MSLLDSVVKAVGGDLTPGFNLSNINPFADSSALTNTPYQKFIGSGSTNQAPSGGQVQGASTNAPTSNLGTLSNSAPSAPQYSTYQQSLLSSLPGQLGNINTYANNAATQGAGDYNTKVQDFLDQQRLAQGGVDTAGQQNELSRIYGNRGVLDMVGQGIRSGGVQLSNANAGSSSASEALARAYGILGRTQQTGVNNQYQQGLLGVQNQQHALDVGRTAGVRDLTQNAQDTVGGIVNNANQQLSYLQQQLVGASLPDQLNIQQQMQQIQQMASNAINPYTQQLNQGVAGIAPSSQGQNRTIAQQQSVSGVAPENQFNYTSSIPAQFQNTGPFASDLPIFTAPGTKKQTA